jgi:hypothetical protein
MKYLKKFENFDLHQDEEELRPTNYDMTLDGDEDEMYPEEEEEEDDEIGQPEPPQEITLEKKKAKGSSYKKSGLKNPEKADLNKDKKISGYEKTRGKAVQNSVEKEKEKGSKGLTAKQKKLPEGLRKAIEARKK